MAITHAKIKIELREVYLKNRPQQLYNISQKGTIPVIQLSDNSVIDESIDIMKWALTQYSSDWYYHNTDLQNEMINHNDVEFKQWLDKYKYHGRHLENRLEFYRDKCAETLSHYEISLGKTSYLLGDNIQLVDVAIFPFVRQCANIDREWFVFKFPNLERWLENWIQSGIFNRVMPKYKAWELDAPPLYISFHLGGK